MKFSILAVLGLLVSVSSFASGKNLVLCGWNENDDSLAIREDVGGQLVALFSMVDHGTVPFKVELQPVKRDQMGAERDYEGSGFSLHINTDWPSNKSGFYSIANIPSMNVDNEVFRCHIAE